MRSGLLLKSLVQTIPEKNKNSTFSNAGVKSGILKRVFVANKDDSCTEAAPCQGTQDWGGFGGLVPDTSPGRVNQSDGYAWFFHGGGAAGNSYDNMISRIIRGSGWKYLIPNDFEYRFTYEDDNYA